MIFVLDVWLSSSHIKETKKNLYFFFLQLGPLLGPGPRFGVRWAQAGPEKTSGWAQAGPEKTSGWAQAGPEKTSGWIQWAQRFLQRL